MRYSVVSARSACKNKYLILGIVSLVYFFAPLHAAPTPGNYAEMATALAAIPLDITAHACDQKKVEDVEAQQKIEKRAALLHITADAMSIVNKMLFFYNHISAQKVDHVNWSCRHREFVVNAAWMIRDITKLFVRAGGPELLVRIKKKIFGDSVANVVNNEYNLDSIPLDAYGFPVTAKPIVPLVTAVDEFGFPVMNSGNIFDASIFQFDSTALTQADSTTLTQMSSDQASSVQTSSDKVTTETSDEIENVEEPQSCFTILTPEERAKLAYALQVVALPSLKGLTAFALACTQEYATNFSGKQARRVATAAHSLVRLSEEYTDLPVLSPYKKLLAAVLAANVVWLGYEIREYSRQPKMTVAQGICVSCQENDKELVMLNCCKKSACRACLANYIKNEVNDDAVTATNEIQCPLNCKHFMTRQELQELTNNDPEAMFKFDQATCRKNESSWEELLKITIQKGGLKCPNPNRDCKRLITRSSACQHMTCDTCRYNFCYFCGGPYGSREQGRCESYDCIKGHRNNPRGQNYDQR